jgi:hypothetical protein
MKEITPEVKALMQAVLDGKQFEVDNWGDDNWYDTSPEHALYKIGLGRAELIRVKDKFSELKKAHKNGAVIEFKMRDGSWVLTSERFGPMWKEYTEYRVKPAPKPDYSKFTGLYEGGGYHTMSGVWSGINAKFGPPATLTDDHVIVNKLEIVFDGETNQVKNVIVHSPK